MSNLEIRRPKGKVKRNLKALGAIAATIAVALPGAAEAKPQPTKASKPDIALKLKNVIDLEQAPGHNLKVTQAQRSTLKNSAVSVLSNYRTEPIWGNCSGNAINYQNIKYVRTNAHCFENATSVDSGLLGPMQGNKKALDFLNLSNKKVELGITDQNYPIHKSVNGKRVVDYYLPPSPMSYVQGLSIGLRNGDDALLLPDTKGVKPSARSRSFDQVVSLSYNPAIQPLEQGQQVALYSMPGDRAIGISGTGIYAGRMQLADEKRKVDVVVEHSRDKAHDPCAVGASGSTAIAADNHQLVGLSEGLYFGYGGDSVLEAQDDELRNYSRRELRHIEAALEVNIPTKYNSFCFFDVSDAQTMPNLVGGFGVYATEFAYE